MRLEVYHSVQSKNNKQPFLHLLSKRRVIHIRRSRKRTEAQKLIAATHVEYGEILHFDIHIVIQRL